MAYEYSSSGGVIRLEQERRRWTVEFRGRRAGQWRSPDAALLALVRHSSGINALDRLDFDLPKDLLDWTPTGDSL